MLAARPNGANTHHEEIHSDTDDTTSHAILEWRRRRRQCNDRQINNCDQEEYRGDNCIGLQNGPHDGISSNGLDRLEDNDNNNTSPSKRIRSINVDNDQNGIARVHVDLPGQKGTTCYQTFIHLLKGNVGPGCLSLPWAISQLSYSSNVKTTSSGDRILEASNELKSTGVVVRHGVLAIFLLAFWTSYNCWIIVKLKRYILLERKNQHEHRLRRDLDTTTQDTNTIPSDERQEWNDECIVTFPMLGLLAYGGRFYNYVLYCISIQQLAICTVFISFVGTNLTAVFRNLYKTSTFNANNHNFLEYITTSYEGIITICIPFILMISFVPTLKHLSVLMTLATVLLFIGFGILAYLISIQWHEPTRGEHFGENDVRIESNSHHDSHGISQVPLGLCAILYSFEGICLILPVEESMQNKKHFFSVFTFSMIIVAMIFASVSSFCVAAFGRITNGSITAFLLERYNEEEKDDLSSATTLWLLELSNAVVSLSVIFTYPLQLFPAIEVLGPVLSKYTQNTPCTIYSENQIHDNNETDSLPVAWHSELDSLTQSVSQNNHHQMAGQDHSTEHSSNTTTLHNTYQNIDSSAVHRSAVRQTDERRFAKKVTFLQVTNDNDNVNNVNESNHSDVAQRATGDSLQLRTFLVLLTYFIAVLVPNVQILISLAGALAGSSLALLIPPMLELSYIRSLEEKQKEFSFDVHSTLHISTSQLQQLVTGNSDDSSHQSTNWKYSKIKCYLLLGFGVLFTVIGTYASLLDIIMIYI